VASSTVKKVVVRRFERENLAGFVNPFSYLQPLHIELLKPEGSLVLVPYEEVKSVCFVKDFEAEPEVRRVFLTRPKLEGLWIRMVFRDDEVLDGILPNDLLAAGAGWQQSACFRTTAGPEEHSGAGGSGQPSAGQAAQGGGTGRPADALLNS
jgi:hypothetical protein